ncbi:MAG: hybrid sensor histidine kinase/response regulator [Desulfomonilaceae bacterium]
MAKVPKKDCEKSHGCRKGVRLRHQAESLWALRTKEHFNEFLENAPEIFYTHDSNGNYTSVNPAVEKILGYSRSEFLKFNVHDIVHPDYLHVARSLFSGKNRHRQFDTGSCELKVRAKDGNNVWISVISNVLYENGIVVSVFGSGRDISEIKLAEEQLKHKDRLLQSLAVSANYLFPARDFACAMNDAIRTLGESLAVDRVVLVESQDCQKKLCKLTKQRFVWVASKEDKSIDCPFLQGRSLDSIFPRWLDLFLRGRSVKGLVRSFPESERQFLESQGIISTLMVPINVGSDFWGFLAFYDCHDEREWNSTELAIISAVAVNIGGAISRRKFEQALKANEERYRLLVDNAPIGIISFDKNGCVLDVNRKLLEILGFPSEKATKSINLHTFKPLIDAGISRAFDNCCKEGAKVFIECLYTSKLGKTFVLRILFTPIRSDLGEILGCQALVENVTHEAELQKKLAQAQRFEALGLVAGGVAHDFNNLLQVIIGYSNLLLSSRKSSDKDFSELQKISKAAESGAELVQSLLTFSRKIESTPRALDLNEIVDQFKRLISRTVPKMISIQTILDPDTRNIFADPVQIQQVLMNLSMNAKDAMPEGGQLTFRTKNIILEKNFSDGNDELPAGPYVYLSVSDTGAGVSKEILDQIFEPFFTTKAAGQGSGLGLSIVYGIIKKLKGYISCSSQKGTGTKFEILLPTIKQKQKTVQYQAAPKKGPSGLETILFVDDEPAIRELAGAYLTQSGYKTFMASNGTEALSFFTVEKAEIDLIVIDLLMPEMGGLKLIDEIRKLKSNTKIVVTSGQFVDESTKKIIQYNSQFFLAKPYDMIKFLEIIREILDQKSYNES